MSAWRCAQAVRRVQEQGVMHRIVESLGADADRSPETIPAREKKRRGVWRWGATALSGILGLVLGPSGYASPRPNMVRPIGGLPTEGHGKAGSTNDALLKVGAEQRSAG